MPLAPRVAADSPRWVRQDGATMLAICCASPISIKSPAQHARHEWRVFLRLFKQLKSI